MTKAVIDHDKSGIKEYLYETVYKPNLKASPLKSLEIQEKEAREQIDQAFNNYVNLLIDGVDLFQKQTQPSDKEKLDAVIKKATEENPEHPLDFDDGTFLGTIASKELAENRNENAVVMFNWIILCLPTFGPAWVGSAIAEQQLDHIHEATAILETAQECMPNDYFVKRYAAEFYFTLKNVEKARQILESSLKQMKVDQAEDTEDYKIMNDLLSQIRS